MFHKPFRVKANTAVKSSERRKIRTLLENQLHVSAETSAEIIPNKDDMTVAKVVTHSGQIVNVFVVNKNPVLFEDRGGVLYPTVTLLWRYPDLLPRIRTWEPVYHKLCGGADLMLPGVVTKGFPTAENLHRLRKLQPVAIHVIGNVAAVAIAFANLSADDMIGAAMRGKGFIVVHTLNDELFKFGKDKPRPPLFPDLELSVQEVEELEKGEGEGEQEQDVSRNERVVEVGGLDRGENSNGQIDECSERFSPDIRAAESGEPAKESPTNRESVIINSSSDVKPVMPAEEAPLPVASPGVEMDDRESLTGLIADLLLGNDDEEEGTGGDQSDLTLSLEPAAEILGESASGDDPWSSISMDDRLEFYLKVALRFHLRPASELPASPQEIYRMMQSACPQENVLDFRKSSYKKPVKFLQAMQSQGFLKIHEETKGVWMITEANKGSETLRRTNFDFLPYLERNDDDDGGDDPDSFQPPVVRELLSVNASVLPLFRDAGITKGTGVTIPDLRKVVTEYVRKNELCPPDAPDKSRVAMNPELAAILLEKGENNVVALTWNQIFQRLPKKMGQCYSLEYPGQPPIFKKGGLPPVSLNVETRSGNKKVTLVTNLETYGVNPAELGKEIRVQAAASTSVSAAPGQKMGVKQLLIQGNQVNLVVAILTEKYNIEKKHISGIEKGEKKKKR